MTDDEMITQILEYMYNRQDYYQRKIINIRDNRFYNGFNEMDYYDLLIANVELRTAQTEFLTIRNFISIYLMGKSKRDN